MTRAKWTVLVETIRADGATERFEIGAPERDLASPTPSSRIGLFCSLQVQQKQELDQKGLHYKTVAGGENGTGAVSTPEMPVKKGPSLNKIQK